VVGVVLTAALFWKTCTESWERFRIRFEGDTSIRVGIVVEALSQRLLDLEAVRRFYYGSAEVDRQEFRAFLAPLRDSRAGVAAMAWVPKVAAGERAGLEAAARREGFATYQFQECNAQGELVRAAVREWHYPVHFVEPMEGNQALLGYDLAADGVCRPALERAAGAGNLRRLSCGAGRTARLGRVRCRLSCPCIERGCRRTPTRRGRPACKGLLWRPSGW